MYLLQHLKERVSTWFYDKKEDRYALLDNIPFYIYKPYIQEKILDTVRYHLYYTDLINNEIKIKLETFDNVWLKIINQANDLQVELFTVFEQEELTFLSVDKINHNLFYELITTKYKNRYFRKDNEHKSKWIRRQNNYEILHQFANQIHSLDLHSFTSKHTIEISLEKLKVYNQQVNLNKVPVNNILFFRALQDDSLLPALNNYTLLFDQKIQDFDIHYSHLKTAVEHHDVCNLFAKYSITKKHMEYLARFNKNNTINLVLDYTEASLNFPTHNNSYYYEVLKDRLEQKNIYTYFMFLRLAFLGKLDKLPDTLIESLDDNMLELFDKLTIGLLKVCDSPELQYATLYTNNHKKTLEVNIWNIQYEEIKELLYQLLQSAPNKNTITHDISYLSKFLIEMMSSSVLQVRTLSEASELIENFDKFHNLKKLKLKHKLEKKLVSKETTQKEKVKKI